MAAFGPYEVLEQVAVGSTGTVFRARHAEIGRVVAVKVLHPGLLAVPGLLERFRAEARMLAGLDDPHVVKVYDFVEEPGRAWLAQEWVQGATLQAILQATGTLTPEQSVGALHGALQGLAHAHGRGLVHRDIAPGNVIADMAGTSKLLDFGLAAPVGDTGACGTPAFVSPEAVRGDAVGKPADVYSAGCVLFLLLSGAPPFPAVDAATALRRHREDPPPALTGHGRELADLIRRCLAKDPAQRPPDAAALLAELEQAATRRYGAAWLGVAGLASGVGATVTAGLGTGGSTAAAELVTAADTIQTATIATGIDTGARATTRLPKATPAVTAPPPLAPPLVTPPVAPPVTPAVAHARKRPRRLPKAPVLAAAAVVLIGGGTATAITLTSGSSKPSAEPSATPLAAPSAAPLPTATTPPTATAPPLSAAGAPNGTYSITYTVVTSTNPLAAPGTTRKGSWTVTTTCPAGTCAGTIVSAQGAHYTTTWDGATLVATGTREDFCYDHQSGQPLTGSLGTYREQLSWRFAAVGNTAAAPPSRLTGSGTESQTRVRQFGDCVAGTTQQTRTGTLQHTA